MTPKALELALQEGRRPTWEMALLYPDQGRWTVDEYLGLDIGRHVDYSRGCVELQAMPDEKHQAIVFFVVQTLKAFALRHGGKATMAPFPMKLWEEKYREPDVLYMRKERLGRCKGKFWEGADLVVEVLSESNREEDLETKRAEYARAEIPEYWIVDRTARTITILTLAQRDYVVHAAFKEGEQATSKILPGLAMDVTSALAAE